MRIFRAPCLSTTSPTVTWPSPAMATMPSRRTPRMVVLRMILELGWDTRFGRWPDMMMDFLDGRRRRHGEKGSWIRTISSVDSSQLAESAGEVTLTCSREIRATLDHGSTRGAFVLTPASGLHQVGVTAALTDAINGLVPGNKVTGGVPLAAKERAPLFRTALDNFPFVAGWTADADPLQERTRVATIREPAARLELPELP